MGITVDNLDITIDDGDLVITGSAYENDKKAIEDKFSEDLFNGIVGTSVNLQVKEGSTVGWENYPCVTDSGVIPEQYFDDNYYGNTSKYSIKLADNTTGVFFQDGTYTVGESQEKKNYKCDGNNIVDKGNNTVLFKSQSQNTTDDASKTGGNTSGGNTTGGKTGGSAGGGSSASSASAATPAFSAPQQAQVPNIGASVVSSEGRIGQIVSSAATEQGARPIQTYVVGSQVSTQQQLDRRVSLSARMGG